MAVKLRPLRDGDLPQVEIWLARSHVRPWFRNPEVWLHEMRRRGGPGEVIHHLIAEQDGQRVGFCQYYPCGEDEFPWGPDLPRRGSWSVDYLIGEMELLGRGLGREMVEALLKRVFAVTEATRVVVQPDGGNRVSRNTLLSCGFLIGAQGIFVLTRRQWLTQSERRPM